MRTFAWLAVLAAVVGCTQEKTPVVEVQKASLVKYPETRRVEQIDTIHGVKVADPYRWLEQDVREAPEVAAWVKLQNEAARAYLDAIPQRPQIERRLTELYNYARYSAPTEEGGKYFYLKNDGLQNQAVLHLAEAYNAEGARAARSQHLVAGWNDRAGGFCAESGREAVGLRAVGGGERLAADLPGRRGIGQRAAGPFEVGPLQRPQLGPRRQRLLL